ncbi:MAG: 4Fe-4S binding protein [Pseudomonadota bacterium]
MTEPEWVSLPAGDSINGKARTAALAVSRAAVAEPVGKVAYQSAGKLLVIGTETAIEAATAVLGSFDNISATGLVTANGAGAPLLTGYLGHFELLVAAAEPQVYDLVLDLGSPPLLQSELPPPGYFAPGDNPVAVRAALDGLTDLTGEFEKPQYFHYDASICAHGRSGITACTRCLQSCPTDAITSAGDAIEVNPNLCQGAGSCATACPTGAITYSYPRLSDSLDRLRAMLKAYRENGGTDAVLLFHDGEAGHDVVAAVTSQLPEHILPVEVEELGSVGMDTWLSALAYGAAAVVLLGTSRLPRSVENEIQAQLGIACALLAGMGYSPDVLLYTRYQDTDLIGLLGNLSLLSNPEPAGFAGLNEKRTVIRLAVDHLFASATGQTRPLVSLPSGAPFGEVLLDKTRCTLCLACVSQCPASALSAGDEAPQLGFIEANCVQCGLCCRTCPEDAIAITPRYLYDFPTRNTRRILFEEEPFACIVCGKPFATRQMIEKIIGKMKGHPMFQGPELERLKMCEDCRVKAMLANKDDGKPVSPGGFS